VLAARNEAGREIVAGRSPRRCCATARKPAAKPVAGIVWISPRDAQRCRGELPVWLGVPLSLPAAAPTAPAPIVLCLGSATLLPADFVPSWKFSPPDPPPRIV
jgi:hypothetical protein